MQVGWERRVVRVSTRISQLALASRPQQVAHLSFIHLRLEGHHLLRAAGQDQRRFAAPKRIPQVKHNDKHLSATAVPLAKPITTGSALPDVYSAITDGVEEMLGISRGCVYRSDGFCLSKSVRRDVSSVPGTGFTRCSGHTLVQRRRPM